MTKLMVQYQLSIWLLLYASKCGHLEMVKYLVGNGADMNAKNKYNRTALMYAFEDGYLEIIKYLIKEGADLNENYNTVLLDACKNNNEASLILASENGHFD